MDDLPPSSIYNLDEPAVTQGDRAAALQETEDYFRLWRKRALYVTAAFLLSCASVIPFSYGYPLHAYWHSFGNYLLYLSEILLIPCVISVGIAISSWIFLRKFKKDPFRFG